MEYFTSVDLRGAGGRGAASRGNVIGKDGRYSEALVGCCYMKSQRMISLVLSLFRSAISHGSFSKSDAEKII